MHLVERQRLDVDDDVLLQRLVFALPGRRQRLVLQLVLDVLILQPSQLLIGVGNPIEGLQNLPLPVGFHRGKRNGTWRIVVVEVVGRRQQITMKPWRRLRRRGGRDPLAESARRAPRRRPAP